MATLKLRELSKIHPDKKIVLNNQGGTLTHVAYAALNNKDEVSITGNHYQSNGCCTNTMNPKVDRLGKGEWMFIKYNLATFPSEYRNLSLIREWIDFINQTLPWAEIFILYHNEETIIDEEFWKTQNIKFNFSKGHVYFAVKKFTNSGVYRNLFVLSLIRYFSNSEYYFMIYDTLRLRKLPSLKDLTNWEIMNIAKFGVQINDVDHSGTNYPASIQQYGLLRDYRSPLYLRWLPEGHAKTIEAVERSLQRGNSQNASVCNGKHIGIHVIYLMLLFQKRQYKKIYDLITDKKHVILGAANKLSAELLKMTPVPDFYNMNRVEIDWKEYGKTL